MSGGATLAWDGGGEGAFLTVDGDAVTLRSSRPFAPGSRPSGTLGTGGPVRLKVHRSRREGDVEPPVYVVEGRLLDATRELRARIAATIAAPSGG